MFLTFKMLFELRMSTAACNHSEYSRTDTFMGRSKGKYCCTPREARCTAVVKPSSHYSSHVRSRIICSEARTLPGAYTQRVNKQVMQTKRTARFSHCRSLRRSLSLPSLMLYTAVVVLSQTSLRPQREQRVPLDYGVHYVFVREKGRARAHDRKHSRWKRGRVLHIVLTSTREVTCTRLKGVVRRNRRCLFLTQVQPHLHKCCDLASSTDIVSYVALTSSPACIPSTG